MPIKVRCKGCEKVLNVPDRARGKAIKCPKCETVLKIPAAGAAGKKKKKPQTVPQPVNEDDPFGGLDLRRAADSRVRVCVKCGAEAEEEVVDCESCGHNVDTGIMSEAVRKKRARRGPDPEEYWSVAWTGSLKFMKDNIGLVWRSATYWVLFGVLFGWTWFWWIFFNYRYGIQFETSMFFGGLCTVFYGGAVGWFWHLNGEVIKHTMSGRRNKKVDRVHFDFFLCVGRGLVAAAWPYILFFLAYVPIYIYVAFIAGRAASEGAVGFGEIWPEIVFGLSNISVLNTVLGCIVLVLSIIVFPLAQVHMTMPYKYKAFTPYHMGIAVGKCIMPSLYYFVQFLTAILPLAITALILHLTWEGGLIALMLDTFQILFDLSDWILELIGVAPPKEDAQNRGWWNFFLVQSLIPISLAVFLTPLCIALAFGAVFLMRANGYIGLYFRDKLDLVKEQTANEPCGFWPRYLAFLVDYLILEVAFAFILLGVLIAIYLLNMVGVDYLIKLVTFAYYAALILIPWLYFAKPQSAYGSQASLGKAAIGLIVTDDNGDVISFGQATGRFFIKTLLSNFVMLFVGSVMSAFTERKRATHDQLVNTLVVWKGDDERNQV